MAALPPFFPKGLKVLLVDDEHSISVTESQLRRPELQYTVTCCHSSSEALAYSKGASSSFDVVLAEAKLVASDEVTGRAFVDAFEDTPVVLMSEGSTTDDVMRAVTLGAVDFLDKPVSFLKLKNIWQHSVRKMMQRTSLYDTTYHQAVPAFSEPIGIHRQAQPSISSCLPGSMTAPIALVPHHQPHPTVMTVPVPVPPTIPPLLAALHPLQQQLHQQRPTPLNAAAVVPIGCSIRKSFSEKTVDNQRCSIDSPGTPSADAEASECISGSSAHPSTSDGLPHVSALNLGTPRENGEGSSQDKDTTTALLKRGLTSECSSLIIKSPDATSSEGQNNKTSTMTMVNSTVLPPQPLPAQPLPAPVPVGGAAGTTSVPVGGAAGTTSDDALATMNDTATSDRASLSAAGSPRVSEDHVSAPKGTSITVAPTHSAIGCTVTAAASVAAAATTIAKGPYATGQWTSLQPGCVWGTPLGRPLPPSNTNANGGAIIAPSGGVSTPATMEGPLAPTSSSCLVRPLPPVVPSSNAAPSVLVRNRSTSFDLLPPLGSANAASASAAVHSDVGNVIGGMSSDRSSAASIMMDQRHIGALHHHSGSGMHCSASMPALNALCPLSKGSVSTNDKSPAPFTFAPPIPPDFLAAGGDATGKHGPLRLKLRKSNSLLDLINGALSNASTSSVATAEEKRGDAGASDSTSIPEDADGSVRGPSMRYVSTVA